MTPSPPAVLADLAALMARNAAPDVPPAERAGALGLSAMVLGVAAELFDRQAHILVEENRAVRTLLARGAELLPNPGDGARLNHLAQTTDVDFRVSALQAANAELRRALIELQCALEGDPRPGARVIEAAIWDELRAATERRKLAASSV